LSGSGGNRYEQSFVKTVGLVTLLSVLNEEETNMGQWEDVVTAHSKFVSAVKDKDIKVNMQGEKEKLLKRTTNRSETNRCLFWFRL
jgi:hypothetical protein